MLAMEDVTELTSRLDETIEEWRRDALMEGALADHVPPAALRDTASSDYWKDTKMSDALLKPVLEAFSSELRVPPVLRKGDYHQLVSFLEPDEVDPEVLEVLDGIVEQAELAVPDG